MTAQPSFTIDRQTWNRGRMPDSCLLSRQHGRMCCLGHIALQCGFTPEQISGRTTPDDLHENYVNRLDEPPPTLTPTQQWFFDTFLTYEYEENIDYAYDSTFTLKAMHINDASKSTNNSFDYSTFSNDEIESELIKHFASAGISITFTN